MTMTTAPSRPRRRPARRHHLAPLLASGAIGACALAAIVYLLWPTWHGERASDPDRLPVTIGNTLFNVPTKAIRVKLQKRTGPQERVDLGFLYPSLDSPQAPRHVTAATVETEAQPIDRIFVSIAAHHGAISPDERIGSIYPRYLETNATAVEDGLTWRAFRETTPYAGEDLASAESFIARCTRDAATPGMCFTEMRIEGADLNFRFPRAWLGQWREVAAAIGQLVVRMRGAHG